MNKNTFPQNHAQDTRVFTRGNVTVRVTANQAYTEHPDIQKHNAKLRKLDEKVEKATRRYEKAKALDERYEKFKKTLGGKALQVGLAAAIFAGGSGIAANIKANNDQPDAMLKKYEEKYSGYDFGVEGPAGEITIKSGDTLYSTIAPKVAKEMEINANQEFAGQLDGLFEPETASEIVQDMNPDVDWNNLQPGDKIKVPARETPKE